MLWVWYCFRQRNNIPVSIKILKWRFIFWVCCDMHNISFILEWWHVLYILTQDYVVHFTSFFIIRLVFFSWMRIPMLSFFCSGSISMLKYMLEDSMNLYYDKSFYMVVFTSLIIRIMISLDLHHNQDNPDFSYLELFPPHFYNFSPPF